MVRIRYNQIEGAKPGAVINIIETKTGKSNVLVINKAVHKALQAYMAEIESNPDDFLFKSRKGNGHITSQSVGRMVRSWASAINLKGRYGAHTLRKTLGLSATNPAWRRLRDPLQEVQPLIPSHHHAVLGHRRPRGVRVADE